MRPNFVFIVTLVAAAVLAVTFFFKPPARTRQPSAPAEAAAIHPPAATDEAATSLMLSPVPVVHPARPSRPVTPQEQEAFIEAELARLQEWSTQNDPAAFTNILRDLKDANQQVRLAAIEAAKQAGNRDAIPVLQEAAADATEPEEKMALLEAAEFLALPAIDEVRERTPKTPEQIRTTQPTASRSQDSNAMPSSVPSSRPQP